MCKGYILDYKDYPMSLAEPYRQIRTHTCFSYCKTGNDKDFLGDDREECISIEDPAERDKLICLYPEPTDYCETTSVSNQMFIGDPVNGVVFAPYQGLYAMIIANPLQILWDFLAVTMMKWKVQKSNPIEQCKFLAFQLFMISVFCTLTFMVINMNLHVLNTGDGQIMTLTFLSIFIFDQLKQFFTLSIVYLVVVRRFGYLKENEKEFIDADYKDAKKEKAIPNLKVSCLKFLEHQYVETVSIMTIGLYSVFILYDLTLTTFLPIPKDLIDRIDFIFLTIFFIEIALKSFASSFMFLLLDFFNMFDATIVIASWFLNIAGITMKGLGVLRLIRVVVITMRSITGSKNKLRHQSKLNNPVDSVVNILKALQQLEISNSVKKEAKFAVQVIEDNKLYDLAVDISSDDKMQDMEAKAWLNITTETFNDTTLWFERDLDDFLKELHRDDIEIDQNQIEEDEERLRQMINVNARQWTVILKLMDEFEKWDFDVFVYCETLD